MTYIKIPLAFLTFSTVREERFLTRMCLRDRRLTVPQMKAELQQFCNILVLHSSIRRTLHQFGLYGRVATRQPALSKSHKAKRLAFAQTHAKWEAKEWQTVVFSDKSCFKLWSSDGRTYVFRSADEKYHPPCMQMRIQGGGGSVMVWGCFAGNSKGTLH